MTDQEKKANVYAPYDPHTDHQRYVGQTTATLSHRLREHGAEAVVPASEALDTERRMNRRFRPCGLHNKLSLPPKAGPAPARARQERRIVVETDAGAVPTEADWRTEGNAPPRHLTLWDAVTRRNLRIGKVEGEN